jgi:hypothetical protein
MNNIAEWYQRLYNEDERFKTYVDAYCRKHKITPKAAFDHVIVRSVGDHYRKREAQDVIS